MRKFTRGLITACAGLAAGAAFGATPAMAGPGWWPPGHVAGYYGSIDACTSYASTLVLWDDDYDCDYWPQRVATPYALVIQRPVLIQRPIVVTLPDRDDDQEPIAQEPIAQEPADQEPAPEEPPGTGQAMVASDKSTTVTKVKAVKSKPAVKTKPAIKVKPTKAKPMIKSVDSRPAVKSVTTYADDQCVDVVATCTDVSVVAVPVVPVVPVVHHPLGGAWHHPWY